MRRVISVVAILSGGVAAAGSAPAVEILTAVGGLPPHVVGTFREPAMFAQLPDGDYLVLDRRGHTVSRIDAARTTAREDIAIGSETGRVLRPAALIVAPGGRYATADFPNEYQRVQYFTPAGTLIGGFYFVDHPVASRLAIESQQLSGLATLQFNGLSFLLNYPESDSLMTEFNLEGFPVRQLGLLRADGREASRGVHLALNSGIPLVDPAGGYYFVFQAGLPVFRKYDQDGALIFERHIEGIELDALIQNLPTSWPATEGAAMPLVAPLVRTASVDGEGRLWISLVSGFTYVYDRNGEKIRTIQFRAAGVVNPTSLFFSPSGQLLVTPGCYVFDVN